MAYNTAKYYLIGEVMSLTGATREMLRNYERGGLIKPITAGENNYRLYSSDDIRKIVKIGVLDELGLDTKTSKKVTVGRSATRVALVENNFDLSQIVEKRADELLEIIKELSGRWLLAKMLQKNILPFFSSTSDDNDIINYTNGIKNSIEISKYILSVIKHTVGYILASRSQTPKQNLYNIIANALANSESADSLSSAFKISVEHYIAMIDFLYSSLNELEEENEIKILYIGLINAIKYANTGETIDNYKIYINKLICDSSRIEEELSKSKRLSVQIFIEIYTLLIKDLKLIPQKCVPKLLEITYRLSKDKIESIDVESSGLFSNAISCIIGKEKKSLVEYTEQLFYIISEKAILDYTMNKEKEDEETNQTPLYTFLNELK